MGNWAWSPTSSAVKLDPRVATGPELERLNVPIWLQSSTYTPPTSTRDKNVLSSVTQLPVAGRGGKWDGRRWPQAPPKASNWAAGGMGQLPAHNRAGYLFCSRQKPKASPGL